jgi:hypothetical protein
MPVRKRTKAGRFVKSRKRTTKKRAYKVKSRKAPAFYSPKKGQRKLAPARARKAYAPKRKSNPKSMFNTPAFKYAAAAGVGVALGEFVNAQKWANPVNAEGKAMLGPIKGSVFGAAITFILAQYAIKGAANKNYARAAAVGMLINPAISAVKGAIAPTTGGASSYQSTMNRIQNARGNRAQLATSSRAAHSFANASRTLDHVPA